MAVLWKYCDIEIKFQYIQYFNANVLSDILPGRYQVIRKFQCRNKINELLRIRKWGIYGRIYSNKSIESLQ